MTRQNIGIGSSANDGNGDTLRQAGTKINANFAEIYAQLGGGDSSNLSTQITFEDDAVVFEGTSANDFETRLKASNPSQDNIITLPDSTGTLLTREFITTLVDSNYVALRQGASIVNLEVDDSAGDQKILVPITQAPTIVTGSPIGFGNTISVLLADSSSFTISL